MDLVTDYKKYYTNGADRILEHLRTIYKKDMGEKHRDFYLQIDKYYRALLIWEKAFSIHSHNIERDKLLDNILRDYCSMIHNIVFGDVKVLYFLLRNIIESFVRYISNNLLTIDLESLFSNVAKNCVESAECQNYVRTYMAQLKQVYDKSCLYIHADTTRVKEDVYTLLEIYGDQNTEELEAIKKEFVMINVAMLCLLKVKNVAVFRNMKENAQGYLDFVIPLEKRVQEQKILN